MFLWWLAFVIVFTSATDWYWHRRCGKAFDSGYELGVEHGKQQEQADARRRDVEQWRVDADARQARIDELISDIKKGLNSWRA